MQPGHFLIELLRERVHLTDLVFGRVARERYLRQRLVREAVGHHEARVAGCAAEVHEAAAREHDNRFAVGEDELIDLEFDVEFFNIGIVLERFQVDERDRGSGRTDC